MKRLLERLTGGVSYLRMMLVIAVLMLSGCASSLEAEKIPGVDLADLDSFYVRKLPADGRGVERLIADELTMMGKRATSGAEQQPPYQVDAIVTYQDKWMWDITMYMINLSIQVRDAENDLVLARGNSMRSSLARKSPEDMVKEVLVQIFSER
ncbi:MAG: hypothetical protein VBE63_29020 [Lamprobacter sp.]|uniref:hypothetical protein n=1 Tax=Lamprobacter sp. TaxID=3100796 RepID=UPI002B25B7AB|nr:hypothetical protein [Lamprobacter sp.]MEA3643937.1 hypothetical protein [Lamprobacter sp.]